MALVNRFIQMRRNAIIKKYWSVKMNPKESFSYKWRNPFIPALFFDSERVRLIISPTREFIDPVCSVCATATGVRYQEIPINELVIDGESKFGTRVFESAVKLMLFENGLAVYAKSVMQAKKWLSNLMNKKIITLEQFMLHYNYSITKTKLRKQFDGLIDESNKMQKFDRNTSKNTDLPIP